MNRGNDNKSHETRIDMDGRNEEKKQILPKHPHKKEKTGSKKMRLEFDKAASLLKNKKIKQDCKTNEKTNNNDHTVIPMEGSDDDYLREESRPKFFGVRNYLHNFYETVSIKNPQLYEDIPDESTINNPTRKENKACRLIWKIGIAVGLITAFIGLIFILVGFITPLHSTIAAKNEEFLVIDRSATTFNDYMHMCRLVGVCMFISGFSLFLAIVLLALCWNIDDDNNDSDDEDSENFCLTFNSENTYQKAADKQIPPTEEVANDQPKREKEEVVMTKSVLCTPSALHAKTDK